MEIHVIQMTFIMKEAGEVLEKETQPFRTAEIDEISCVQKEDSPVFDLTS